MCELCNWVKGFFGQTQLSITKPRSSILKAKWKKNVLEVRPLGGLSTVKGWRRLRPPFSNKHTLYKFKQLLSGVKVEPITLQQVMDAMLNDCDFAILYPDDILAKNELVKQHFEII